MYTTEQPEYKDKFLKEQFLNQNVSSKIMAVIVKYESKWGI